MNTARTTRSSTNQPETSAFGMTQVEKSMRHPAKWRPQHPNKSIIYEQRSATHKNHQMRHNEKRETSNGLSASPQ
jgi:hypothetical protein